MADLTEDAIKSAKPGALLRDATLPGLHLRAFENRKSFYLYFRTKTGQERRPKLGDHGIITLTQARKAAKAMLGEVALGGDPIAVREGARSEHTLRELWAEYWKRHGRHKKSGDEDERMWKRYIEPKIAGRKLSTIGFTEMADLHEALSEDAPSQANRVVALASKMFNFAHRPLQWFDGTNPCKGIKRNKETKRRRKASRDEVVRLAARLRADLDTDNVNSAAFMLLLLFTGARKGEIAACRWDNIHGNRILLDEHKTDDGGYARMIWLSAAALEVLERLPVTSGTITRLLDPKKYWAGVCKDLAITDLTMHDLRRTYASIALSTGKLSLEQVMQMLGHTNAQTTKVYAWLMEDTAAEAANLVGDRIAPRLLPVS